MQAFLPTGSSVNFSTTSSAVTKAVPQGNVLEFIVEGVDVYVTLSREGVSASAPTGDTDGIWVNKLLVVSTIPYLYRRGTNGAEKVSIIAKSGSGTVQVTPGEGN